MKILKLSLAASFLTLVSCDILPKRDIDKEYKARNEPSSLTQSWEDGFRSYNDGVPDLFNPYGGKFGAAWACGWASAKRKSSDDNTAVNVDELIAEDSSWKSLSIKNIEDIDRISKDGMSIH